MTEKNIFAYKPDLSFQIYIYFLCENCKIAPTPLWKKLPPLKLEVLSSPNPPFWKFGWRFNSTSILLSSHSFIWNSRHASNGETCHECTHGNNRFSEFWINFSILYWSFDVSVENSLNGHIPKIWQIALWDDCMVHGWMIANTFWMDRCSDWTHLYKQLNWWKPATPTQLL